MKDPDTASKSLNITIIIYAAAAAFANATKTLLRMGVAQLMAFAEFCCTAQIRVALWVDIPTKDQSISNTTNGPNSWNDINDIEISPLCHPLLIDWLEILGGSMTKSAHLGWGNTDIQWKLHCPSLPCCPLTRWSLFGHKSYTSPKTIRSNPIDPPNISSQESEPSTIPSPIYEATNLFTVFSWSLRDGHLLPWAALQLVATQMCILQALWAPLEWKSQGAILEI